MTRDDTSYEALTRRNYVKYGGAAVVGGFLAGCTGDGGAGATSTPTDIRTEDSSYIVTMSPVGKVTFDSPPETVFTRLTHHADMAFALGRGDAVNAMHAPNYYNELWNQFVERLPGVSLDWSGLYSSWEPSKEKLYELDSDVHLADPAWVVGLRSWDVADIEEIGENVGPWFGNSLSDRHQEPPREWLGDYQYYGLWEQFEKVAQVFRAEDRYRALAAIREEMLGTIVDGLPPENERPTAVMLTAVDIKEDIWAYTLDNPGFLSAHTRPLGPRDAFSGTVKSNSVVDFETLLEGDPDVILFLGGMLPDVSMADLRATLESDPVASKITAVQNDRVHPQGARYQGPILHLFQLEMTAKQLYPAVFGEWPTYTEGPYPEIPEDEQLFDRQRVANIINGRF